MYTFLNSYYLQGNAEGIPEQLKKYPTLPAWYELVRTQPKIQQWLNNSPPDLFDYIYWAMRKGHNLAAHLAVKQERVDHAKYNIS